MSDKKRKVPKLRFPGFTDAWEQRKLGEVVTFFAGLTYSPDNVQSSGTLVLRSSNVKNGEIVDADNVYVNHNVVNSDNVQVGDIIVVVRNGSRDLIGKHAQVKKQMEDTVIGAFMTGIRTKKPEFMNAMLDTSRFEAEVAKNLGATINQITGRMFSEMSFSMPETKEQAVIGTFFRNLDSLISLHQRKLDNVKMLKKSLLQKLFPKDGEKTPELRFPGFTDAWEQRKLGDEFQKVNERNDGSFGREHWISVAKMYFQEPEKVQSNNIDTRTYVMREGDIAFEGHPNSEFKFGRFVANDIGSGVVSELFPIYRHKCQYDNKYWKYAIQLERIMAPIFAKSITSSGNSSNKLEPSHFLRQSMSVATYEEQKVIGDFLNKFESLLSLHQRKLDHLKELKKGLLQQMFV